MNALTFVICTLEVVLIGEKNMSNDEHAHLRERVKVLNAPSPPLIISAFHNKALHKSVDPIP